jgi:hypothetical protein
MFQKIEDLEKSPKAWQQVDHDRQEIFPSPSASLQRGLGNK